jgi:sugar porter (SP) family MFS transporter
VLESISIVYGVVIAFWITYGTRLMAGEVAFRLSLGLQIICATLLGAGIHLFPYSPRWLTLVGRNEECLASLSKLRGLPSTDPRMQKEFKGIVAEVKFNKMVLADRHPGASAFKLEVLSWLDLFDRKMWRRTVVGCGVCFFQQSSGINAFIYYAPTLFRSIGQRAEMALILSGIFNILQLVAVFICFAVIDKVGRRPLAIVGGFGSCICYIVIAAIAGVYSKDWSANPAAGWAAVAMAFCFIMVYGVSYSPLGWSLPPEVLPNSKRAKGVALSVCMNWICNFTVGIATPPMINSIGYGTYIFFAFFCGLSGVWAVLLVPETKGKTLEQMDLMFGDNSGQEERNFMRMAAASAEQIHTSLIQHA